MKLKIRKTRKKCRNIRHKTLKGGSQLEVFYGNQKVSGQELPKNITQMKPIIKFPTTGKAYTLIMWDPDVPKQIQPGFVHWIVTNLHSQHNIENNQLLEYKGPAPPSGVHRYFFGLFEQHENINLQQPARSNFNILEFIKDNSLKKVSEIYMKVSK